MTLLPTPCSRLSNFHRAHLTAFFAAITALFFVAAINDAHGQFTFASDSATNSVYSDGWAASDNGGIGFSAWTFNNSASTGTFIGNPATDGMGTTGIGTTAFAFYSTVNGNYFNVSRSLSTGMGAGDSFSFYWTMNYDTGAAGLNKGIVFQTGGADVFSINNGGTTVVTVNGVDTGFTYGTNPMLVTITRTSASQYSFSMTDKDGVGTYTATISSASSIDGFKIYGSNNDGSGQRNIFFDDFANTNSGVFSQGGTVTNNNTFSGSGNLSIGGNTTLALGGSATYTGTTTITNGSTLRFQSGNSFTFTSAITGGSTSAIVVSNGSGQVNLSNNNTAFDGAITVANGTLEARTANALGSTTGGTVINSGGGLRLWNSGGVTYAAEALTLNGDNGGTGALRNITNNNTWQGAITLGSSSRINSDLGTLTLSGGITGGANVLYIGGAANTTVNSAISGAGNTQGGTTTSIYKDGVGTLTLSGNNTYSGDTRILVGALTVGSGGNLGDGSSDVFISGGATLNVNANATVDSVQETGTGNAGVIAIGSGATLTIDGANKGTLYQNNISGAGSLTVAASGTTSLSLFGTQSYTGTTTVSGGKLSTGVALSSTVFSVAGGTLETSAANLISDTATFTLGGGTFSIGGTETFGSNGVALTTSTTSTVSPTNGVTATITGALSGSGSLIKGDSGTLILTGNSTGFSGNTTVSAGTLLVGNANALGASGAVSVTTGARLQLSNNITVSRSLVLNGDGISTSGSLQNVNGNNTWSGGISNNSGARINSDTGTLTLSGSITNAASQTLYVGGSGNTTISGTLTGATTSGNGALLKNDGGTLTLSANNSGLTGLIRLQGGTISITNANSLGSGTLELGSGATTATLLVNSNTTRTSALAIADSSTAGVIQVASGQTYSQSGNLIQTNGTANTTKVGKAGAGVLVLSGTGSTYGGQFQIGDGSVVIAANNSLSTNTTTANRGVDLGLNVGDVSQGNSVSLLGRDGVTISNSIYVAPNTSSALRTIGIDGSGTTTFNNEIYLDGTLTVDSGASGNRVIISGVLATNYLGLGGGVTKIGAGSLTLSGNNTFSGVLTVSDGKLTVATINNTSANGVLGNSANAVVLGGSGTTGFLHYTGGTASSDKKFTAASGGTAGIEVSNSATKLTLSGLIDGAGGVQKGGSGTLVLSGNNSFTGALNVHDGTLEIASINNVSVNGVLGNSATAVGLGKSSTANTATLLYTGSTASSTRGYSLNSETNAAGVINVSGSTTALTLSGEITGVGRLDKAGAGTLVLSSSNNYAGGTTLSAGVLQLNSVHGAGAGKITQSSGSSTLQINTTGTFANQMSIYNIRTMQNVTLSGAKTLNNATYTVDAGTTTTDSGDLSGSGGVTKQGTGTLTLTGNNTYTGAVAVNAGVLNLDSASGGAAATTSSVSVASGATLLVSKSNQVSNTAAVTLSGGTIQRASGVSEVFGALDLTANSFLNFGSGTAGNMTFGIYEGNATPSALLSVSSFFQGNSLVFGSDISSYIASSSAGPYSGTYFSFDQGFTTTGWNGTTFTITAIPEPSTYLAAAGLLALLLWPARRRLMKDAKSIIGLRATGRERMESYRNA